MHDNIDTATKPPKLFSRFKCANNGIGTDKAETNIAGNNTCFKYALTCSFTIRVISKRRTTNSPPFKFYIKTHTSKYSKELLRQYFLYELFCRLKDLCL